MNWNKVSNKMPTKRDKRYRVGDLAGGLLATRTNFNV